MFRFLTKLHDALFAWFDKHRANRIVFAVGWTAMLGAALLGTLRTTYRANDNAGLMSMVREGLETPFMSPILAKIMSVLYLQVTDGLPWYGLIMNASVLWAMALLIHSLSVIDRARPMFIPALLGFSLMITPFIVRCGYNGSSILLSGIAVLAFATYVRTGRATKLAVVMCGLGLAFAFLFRPRGMQGAMIFVAPAVLAIAWGRWRALALSSLLLFCAPIAITSSVHTVWTTSWMSEEYQNFREFNKKRGKFHAYPIARANRTNDELLAANGWQQFHYDLLTSFFFFDEDVWNVKTMTNIFEMSDEIEHRSDWAEKMWLEYHRFGWLIPLILAGLLALPSRRLLIWIGGYVAITVGIAMFMQFALRFPGRVGDPFLTVVVAGLAFIFAHTRPEWRWRSAKMRKVVAILLTVSFLVPMIGGTIAVVTEADHTGKRGRQFAIMRNWFNDWFVDRDVLAQPAILLSADRNPLRERATDFRTVPSGWQTYSPRFYSHLRRLGLERGADLLPFAVDNERFFFVFSESMIPKIVQFVGAQYGIHTKVRKFVGLSNLRFTVFQLLTDPNPPGEDSFLVEDVETRFDKNLPRHHHEK